VSMANISMNIDDADLEQLREQAKEARVPVTIYARMLLVRAMSDHKAGESVQ